MYFFSKSRTPPIQERTRGGWVRACRDAAARYTLQPKQAALQTELLRLTAAKSPSHWLEGQTKCLFHRFGEHALREVLLREAVRRTGSEGWQPH